jgi:hypothetical protein
MVTDVTAARMVNLRIARQFSTRFGRQDAEHLLVFRGKAAGMVEAAQRGQVADGVMAITGAILAAPALDLAVGGVEPQCLEVLQRRDVSRSSKQY